jgi:hypothetical protein
MLPETAIRAMAVRSRLVRTGSSCLGRDRVHVGGEMPGPFLVAIRF